MPSVPMRTLTGWVSVALVIGATSAAGWTAWGASTTPGPPEDDSSGAAPDRATFGVQPASTLVGVEQFGLDFGVAPGSQIFENVAVVNFDTEPVTLGMYAADAFTTSAGEFGLVQRSQPSTDAGTWIRVGEPTPSIEVPPQSRELGAGRVFLPVTIAVPATAEPGDHAAGVIASLTTLGENPEGQNVELEQRVATRVYIRVDGPLEPGLAVENLTARYTGGVRPWQPGTLVLDYDVVNTGNVRMGYTASSSVVGPFGLLRRDVTADPVAEVLPRGRITTTQEIAGVWPLVRLSATVRLDPAAAPRVEAPDLGPVTEETGVWAVPWLVLVIAAAAVALLVADRLRRRRRRPPAGRVVPEPPRHPAPVEPADPRDRIPQPQDA